jgi:hypothetical protein
MPTLRSQLDALAANFASRILAALQGASLNDLVSAESRKAGGNGPRTRGTEGSGGQPDPLRTPRGKNGRLPRRSAADIANTLDKIVLLVKTQKNGLRAEEIRSKLGMQAKEMPRILKQGIATKKLTSKGRKRATTYFAR